MRTRGSSSSKTRKNFCFIKLFIKMNRGKFEEIKKIKNVTDWIITVLTK